MILHNFVVMYVKSMMLKTTTLVWTLANQTWILFEVIEDELFN